MRKLPLQKRERRWLEETRKRGREREKVILKLSKSSNPVISSSFSNCIIYHSVMIGLCSYYYCCMHCVCFLIFNVYKVL